MEGYTNLLWIIILALPTKAGITPERASTFLSIVFSYLLLLLVSVFPRLINHSENNSAVSYIFAPLLLALSRSYNAWATGGLETRMFSFMILLAFVLILRAVAASHTRSLILSGLLFGLAELARPEAVLLGATAFVLYLIIMRWLKKSPDWKTFFIGASFFVSIVALHTIWRIGYYGRPLPNTYYAKVNQAWFELGGWYLWMFCFEYSCYLLFLPALIFLYRAVRAKEWLMPSLFLFIAPYIFYVAYVGGDHFEYRLLDPLLPILALIFYLMFDQAMLWAKASRIKQAAVALCSSIIIIYQAGLPLSTGAHAPASFQAYMVPQADPAEYPGLRYLPLLKNLCHYFNRSYARLIPHYAGLRWEDHKLISERLKWQADNIVEFIRHGYLKKSERICLKSAGIVPYYSGMWAMDYYGLTDTHVAGQKLLRPQRLFHDKTPDPEYLQSLKIDYLQYKRLLLDQAEAGDRLPALPAEWAGASSPDRWFSRLYLVPMAKTYFMFFSTYDPQQILERFGKRGLTVYLYMPQGANIMYPVPLDQIVHPKSDE